MEPLSGPVIRFATLRDLPGLHALIEHSYRGDRAWQGWTHETHILGGQRITADELAALIADPAHAMLVADDEGAIVGNVEIADLGDARTYLGLLSVDPAQQARGMGRRLVAAAEQAARDRFGATRMEMTAIAQRTELIGWYERLGYRRTGEARPFPYRHDDLAFLQGEAPTMVVLERRLDRPSS